MPNTEDTIKEINSLDEAKGLLILVVNATEALRQSDKELAVQLSSIETKVDNSAALIDDLGTKYKVFKAEDRKGQWALFTLLITTSLGWVAQFFGWLTN